ncbi:MAG: cation-translocating P-type ATPase [Anaerolineales bacterium]|jgi:Ca2+-transporting ATPase
MNSPVPQNQDPTAPVQVESWHTLSAQEVLEHLKVRENGLSSDQVAKRLAQYGPNQLMEAPRGTFLKLLWEQFDNFIVMLLIAATIVSALLGEWVDAGAIITIVLLNAILGIIQEQRAEEALAALKKMAAPEAHVLRGGHHATVSSRDLVPGDIVFLEAGNHIPADLRLLEAVNLEIDESALTGESLPVHKNASMKLEKDIPVGDWRNTAFMGTTITYGRGRGVITGTGMRTQLGLIAAMLQNVEERETPLQKRLNQLGKLLGWGALAICAVIFLVAVFENTQLGLIGREGLLAYLASSKSELVNFFLVAVSLAIAAVPEGLPAVVTISLALGMREMIHRHALIRRLASVETLGSATVICSDKTGTLTQNEMTVTRMWVDGQFVEVTGSGYSRRGDFLVEGKPVSLLGDYPGILTALWVGALNNDADLEPLEGDPDSYRIVGDPTEGCLLIAAAKAGTVQVDLERAYPRLDEVPFDSERKRMVTVHDVSHPRPDDLSPYTDGKKRGWDVIAVKGAPDVVLDLCTHYQTVDDTSQPIDESTKRRIMKANDDMTRDALRVLAVAYRDVPEAEKDVEALERDLIFVGLLGMMDPAREEVKPALAKATQAGIRTVMITGDYPNTARAVAQTIGLLQPGHQVLTGADLDRMSEDVLRAGIEQVDVFARVSPEHKLRIVDALQANGEVVAMTGDGVNDAPAIKRSNIGVAMGITGTDVAKETADIVLTDDNYASIVDAVEQGRIIYSNIRKFVYYLLSCNLAEIASIFLGTLLTRNSPLTAIQLLWLNLITDGAPALALGTEKGDPDIMSQPPRPPKEPIINRFMQFGILTQTIAITGVTLAAYFFGLKLHPAQPEFAESMAFITLSASELFRAYTSRSERYPLFKIGIFTNRNMNLAFLSSMILLLAVVYVPFLNKIFNTVPMGWQQWEVMLPLLLIPSVVAEMVKYIVSRKKTA